MKRTPLPPPPSMSPEAQGRRIRAWLEIIGWDAKRLGEQIGESKSQVSKILNGGMKSGISPVQAWRIARAVGVTEAYIIYGNRAGLPPDVLRLLPPEN